MSGGLGRVLPPDMHHVESYPIARLVADQALQAPPASFDRVLDPWLHEDYYNQGVTGECVGFSISRCMTMLNRYRYDAEFLYMEATVRDPWQPDRDPSTGTGIRYAFDELREQGHVRLTLTGTRYAQAVSHGISANRWAWNVEDIRTAIWNGIPVVLGVDWDAAFDRMSTFRRPPVDTAVREAYARAVAPNDRHRNAILERTGYRLPNPSGQLRGRHAIILGGWLDSLGGGGPLYNSWGRQGYVRPHISAELLHELVFDRRFGEAGIVTDR